MKIQKFIFVITAILLFFFCSECFANTVRWKISADGVLLGDKFEGDRNKNSENFVLGSWRSLGKCTQSYPCFFCQADKYYEFLSDGMFQYWEENGGPQCAPGKNKNIPQKGSQSTENIQRKSGTYKILDHNTVELSAQWEIKDDSIAACSKRCSADEDCIVVLLPKLFGPGGCSPPCGKIYNVVPEALNRYYSGLYIEMLRKDEEDKYNFGCNECEGISPQIPDVSFYRTVCQNSRCLLKEKNK
jgi:hypothetical protein